MIFFPYLILQEMVLDLNDQTFTTFDSLPPSEEMCFSKQNITVDLRGTDLTFGERVINLDEYIIYLLIGLYICISICKHFINHFILNGVSGS